MNNITNVKPATVMYLGFTEKVLLTAQKKSFLVKIRTPSHGIFDYGLECSK